MLDIYYFLKVNFYWKNESYMHFIEKKPWLNNRPKYPKISFLYNFYNLENTAFLIRKTLSRRSLHMNLYFKFYPLFHEVNTKVQCYFLKFTKKILMYWKIPGRIFLLFKKSTGLVLNKMKYQAWRPLNVCSSWKDSGYSQWKVCFSFCIGILSSTLCSHSFLCPLSDSRLFQVWSRVAQTVHIIGKPSLLLFAPWM